jgi:predicted alpha/beta superfamily hydrolase
MKPSKTQNALLIVILFIFSSSLFGQKLEPKERVLEPDHTITSKLLDRDFQLYISFPENYTTKDTITYPVLYLLDGKSNFPLFDATKKSIDFSGEIEDIIIVGIGSEHNFASWIVNRTHDYTPTNDTIHDNAMERNIGFPKGTLQSGNASKFLETLKKEIIPFIDTYYKTNTDRGITGHSLGGLFTTYCFINATDIFTRFGINSPSLWWDEEKLLKQAVLKFEENTTLDMPASKVFISVGEEEGSQMVPEMIKLAITLEDMEYKNVELTWKIFENETHQSVIPANLSRTLKVLYGKK